MPNGSVSSGVPHTTGELLLTTRPLNIFGPESIPQFNEIVMALETDEHLKVAVFDSAAISRKARRLDKFASRPAGHGSRFLICWRA